MSALPKIIADPKDIISQYLDGKKSVEIAKGLGVTQQGLSHWLYANAEDDWKAAQVILARARKDRAEDAVDRIIEEAENADQNRRAQLKLVLAGAEASLRAAQWDLERVCRRVYGQDAPPAGAMVFNFVVERYDAAQRSGAAIDGEHTLVKESDAQSST